MLWFRKKGVERSSLHPQALTVSDLEVGKRIVTFAIMSNGDYVISQPSTILIIHKYKRRDSPWIECKEPQNKVNTLFCAHEFGLFPKQIKPNVWSDDGFTLSAEEAKKFCSEIGPDKFTVSGPYDGSAWGYNAI